MRRVSALTLIVAVAACKKPEAPPPPRQADQVAAPAPAGAAVRGKVLERIDAAPYSYLRLATASGETWAAVPQTAVALGAEVTVENPMVMDGFQSPSLNRTFDKIVFGALPGQIPPAGPAAAQAPPAPAPAGPPPGGSAAAPGGTAPAKGAAPGMATQHAAAAAGPADVGDVKVSRAEGPEARTVAEIHRQRAALKEKRVTLRGKVVKFSGGIMGRNWVHLRDGSGSPGKGDNDITVTTGDSASVGDVVVASGVVRLDKDFGAGYAYPVIVEDAKLSR